MARPKPSAVMHAGVASSTQGNQILARIITEVAAKLFVVDLKVGHCAAGLASPAIAPEHLITESFVLPGVEPNACAFRTHSIHEAFSITWCRNVRLSSPGRNLKNRRADCKRTAEFSFSRFAPARKSAHIISRQ